MSKISVIVPVHNDFEFLPRTLRSIKDQTYKDYEVIIVDDCSQDPSRPVVIANRAEIKDIQVLRHPINRGLPGARNTGIRAAKGEYLVFLDSDDLLTPYKLDMQSHILNNDKDIGMVYSDEYTIYDDADTWDEEKTTQFEGEGPSGMIFDKFLARSFIAVFTVMVRKSVVEEVGMFDENLRYGEDDDLWYRIMLKYPACFSPYVSGVRRLHSNNMSNNRENVAYYQYASWLKIKRTMPDVFNIHKNIFELRTKKRMKSYLKYCLKSLTIPKPRIISQYRELMK